MKNILVHIREKDKGSKKLSLFNLKDEVVNFLYKDTVANSTKSDLQFFVLLHFALIHVSDDKTFLEAILDEALPKFNALNQTFKKKQGYLRAHEYRQRVEEHGLTDVFKYDVFFVILEAVLNIDEIEVKFSNFIKQNPALQRTIDRLKAQYQPRVTESLEAFQSSKIEDDRYDDDGNYHDLSKSVYRTIMMRNARNLELNLQRYTSVKILTSNSPIDLSFIQQVHPQIIFDLWDKFHVADYMKDGLKVAVSIAETVAGGVITQLILDYRRHRRINGAKERKRKQDAKQTFEKSKSENADKLQELNMRLVDAVLKSNQRLQKEIEGLREEKRKLEKANQGSQKNDAIKKLEGRLSQLENLEVQTELVDDTSSEMQAR